MNKIIRFLLIVFIVLLIVLGVPLLISLIYKSNSIIQILRGEWTAGESLMFYGSLLSFAGTITLGAVSVWQTKSANELSERMLNNSLIESTIIPHLLNKIDIDLAKNNDTSITMSSHHKFDYGAIIVVEPHGKNVKKYNQYILNLYFKCSGNANGVKEILVDNILCVQDPTKGGFKWEDESNDPIPLGLDIHMNNKAYLNWVNDDEFYIQIKVYCEPGKIFDSMMTNGANTCMMFSFIISQFNDVKTKMDYKIWFDTDMGIGVLKTNSIFVENIINEDKKTV